MDQRDEQRKRRKKIRNAALVVLALIGVAIIFSGIQNHKQSAVPVTPSAKLPNLNLPPAKPATPVASNSAGHKKTAKPKRNQFNASALSAQAKDAVNAAVLADANLSLSQFQTPAQRRMIIDATVVPARRALFDKTYNYTGQVLAVNGFGYRNIDEARSLSEYNVATQMFRVDMLTASMAKISLFDFTRFRTHDDLSLGVEHKDVGITVLVLQQVAGKWLLVATHDGPGPHYVAGQKVRFEDKLAAFRPYLRGFTRYGNS